MRGLFLLFLGCADRALYLPDPTADLSKTQLPDLASPDLVVPADLASPDLAPPDLAPPDLARPDFAVCSCGFSPVDTWRGPFLLADVAAGDFDGDGHQDFVTANGLNDPAYRRELNLYRGHGDGSFAAPTRVELAGAPTDLAAADLDGDGRSDVAVAAIDRANSPAQLLAEVWRGKSDGTLERAWSVSFAVNYEMSPPRIRLADANGDGYLDVVVLHVHRLWVLLADGSGGFAAPVENLTSGAGLLAAGDLDEDGRLDLVLATQKSLQVYRGRGDGHFDSGTLVQGSWWATALTASDFDGDGHLDVLIDNWHLPSQILRGDGHGAFGGPTAIGELELTGPHSRTLADLDGDGVAELIGVELSDNLRIWKGGTFAETVVPGSGPPIFVNTAAVDVADFDEDGRPDVVAARFATTLALVLNRASGYERRILEPEAAGPVTPIVADFDGDGLPDVAVSHARATSIAVHPGLGDGRLGPRIRTDHGVLWGGAMYPGDFDGDGRIDLVVAADPEVPAVLLGNRGGGSFVHSSLPTERLYYPMGVNDLDGDGHDDVVVQRTTGVGEDVAVVFGQGDGSFATPVPTVRSGARSGAYASSWDALADLDLDGRPELITWRDEFGLAVAHNRGDGTFASPTVTWAGLGSPTLVAVADLDGDGKPDLLGSTIDRLVALPGNGDGTFKMARSSDLPTAVQWTARPVLLDADGDGVPDVVAARWSGLEWLRGQGDGTFQPWGEHRSNQAYRSLAVGDLDRDGRPDVVAVESWENTITVFQNQFCPGACP